MPAVGLADNVNTLLSSQSFGKAAPRPLYSLAHTLADKATGGRAGSRGATGWLRGYAAPQRETGLGRKRDRG